MRDFPGGSMVKNPPANVGDAGSIPGQGRSPGKTNGNPFQYSCWEIPWTEEPGGLLFTGSQKNQTQLSVSMYMSCIFTKHSLGICQKLVGSRFLISLCLADVPAWFQTAVKICSYPEINLDADLCIFVSTKRV